MHYLYIIYSATLDKYYTGESTKPLVRLEQHNSHYFKKGFTNAANDWKIVLTKKCNSKTDAIYLEKFIKRMKSSKFIKKIILNPKILEDILNKK
ncbi:GIY-YIG nuclease family protein [uncultured Maribacter sp.]|uniref:GIY-YIG nuclease family protein n=1 Tax=uncultured Maribacter sp. TaxID=431308 RepID=UPI002601DFBF|nr:GIY-YIG nuclease family protein [uncultured Maribacter sp.]